MILTLCAVLAAALAVFAYAAIRWAEESQRLDDNVAYLILAQDTCEDLDRETGRWR